MSNQQTMLDSTKKVLSDAIATCPQNTALYEALVTVLRPLSYLDDCTSLDIKYWKDTLQTVHQFATNVISTLSSLDYSSPTSQNHLDQLHTTAVNIHYHLDLTGLHSSFFPSHVHTILISDLIFCINAPAILCQSQTNMTTSNRVTFHQVQIVVTNLSTLLHCMEVFLSLPIAPIAPVTSIITASKNFQENQSTVTPISSISKHSLADGKRLAAIQDKLTQYVQQLENSYLPQLDKDRIQKFLNFLWNEQLLSPELVQMANTTSPYNIADLAGVGTSTAIYKARLMLKQGNRLLWTTGIVLKTIALDHGAETKSNTFRYEALRLKTFSHPCLLTYYGAHWPFPEQKFPSAPVSLIPRSATIGMEQMTHSLRKAIDLPALNEMHQRINILIDVTDALKYLHSQQVCHGALTPDNVLVRIDKMKMYGRAKLDPTNLVTKYLRPQTLGTGPIQQLIFYPPEALDGSESGFFTGDIWSFGVLACFLLAKRVEDECIYTNLFLREGPIRMATEWNSRIPDENLRQVVEKCLQRDPKKRLTSQSLYTTLQSALLSEDMSGCEDRTTIADDAASPEQATNTTNDIADRNQNIKINSTNQNELYQGQSNDNGKGEILIGQSFSEETLSRSSNHSKENGMINDTNKRNRQSSSDTSPRKRMRMQNTDKMNIPGDNPLKQPIRHDFFAIAQQNALLSSRPLVDPPSAITSDFGEPDPLDSTNKVVEIDPLKPTPTNENDTAVNEGTFPIGGEKFNPMYTQAQPSVLVSGLQLGTPTNFNPESTTPLKTNPTHSTDNGTEYQKTETQVNNSLQHNNEAQTEKNPSEKQPRSAGRRGRTRARKPVHYKDYADLPSNEEEEILSGSSDFERPVSSVRRRCRGRPRKYQFSGTRGISNQPDLRNNVYNGSLTRRRNPNIPPRRKRNNTNMEPSSQLPVGSVVWPERSTTPFTSNTFSEWALPSVPESRIIDGSKVNQILQDSSKYTTAAVTIAAIQLEEGIRVKKCARGAFQLYRRGVELQDPIAYVRLGALYERGVGTSVDYAVAFSYYQNAAKTGDIHGMIRVAECYATGRGVTKDTNLAAQKIMAASMSRHPEALYKAGIYYEQGIGVLPDFKRAFEYYVSATKENHPGAFYRLACMYSEGRYCVADMKKAVELHTAATKLGHIESKVKLAGHYARGAGVKKNIERAVKLYREAAEKEDPAAMLALGLLYEDGKVNKMTPEQAFGLYEKAAKSGYPPAIAAVGQCYFWGYGIEEDGVKAVQNYIMASRQGNPLAHCELGMCYREGFGLPADIHKALEHFRISIAGGNDTAHVHMGECYYHGLGLEQSLEKAIHHFQIAAELGAPEGYRWMGECYCEGSGVEKDVKKGIEFYRKGVMAGSAFACTSLGSCYERGYGVEVNKTQVVKLYQQASDLGDHTATNNLGLIYEQGKLVKQDYKRAFQYYKKAITDGSVEALCNLADCYAMGFGTEKCMLKAIKYYKEAINYGMSGAMCELGTCYYYGKGVPKSYEKALELFHQASDSEPEALRQLGTAYFDGCGVKRDYKKAVSLYNEAIENGNNEANFNLGICFMEGKGVQKNISEAYKLFEKASKEGHKLSMLAIGSMLYEGNGVTQNYAEAVQHMTAGEDAQVV